MARSFEDVLSEVSRQSDPQRQAVLSQVSRLPEQQAADESALEAKKTKGLEDIMLSARRRGVAYWGAPIAEQNDYFATDYMPKLANLKSDYVNRKSSLEAALGDIGRNDYSTAYNIFNTDRQFAESQRQFNEQLAESRRQSAAASAAPDLSKYLNGSSSGGGSVDPTQQSAYNSARSFVEKYGNDTRSLISDWLATAKSAGYGNAADKYKLQVYAQLRPDLFSWDPLMGGRGSLKAGIK